MLQNIFSHFFQISVDNFIHRIMCWTRYIKQLAWLEYSGWPIQMTVRVTQSGQYAITTTINDLGIRIYIIFCLVITTYCFYQTAFDDHCFTSHYFVIFCRWIHSTVYQYHIRFNISAFSVFLHTPLLVISDYSDTFIAYIINSIAWKLNTSFIVKKH